jgi:hypothetical protein
MSLVWLVWDSAVFSVYMLELSLRLCSVLFRKLLSTVLICPTLWLLSCNKSILHSQTALKPQGECA